MSSSARGVVQGGFIARDDLSGDLLARTFLSVEAKRVTNSSPPDDRACSLRPRFAHLPTKAIPSGFHQSRRTQQSADEVNLRRQMFG